MSDPNLPRRRRARRRLIGLSIFLAPVWALLTLYSLGGLLGALVDQPAVLGWAVTCCGVSIWLAALLRYGILIVRNTPTGRPLTPQAAERIAAVHDRVGTALLALAGCCATAEAVALVVLFVGNGSSTDRTIVATSLAGAAILAVAGHGNRLTARRLPQLAGTTPGPQEDQHEPA